MSAVLPGARAVTARAVQIGLLGAALLCAVTPYNNKKIAATLLGGNQFPIFALFVLIVLAGVNVPLRLVRPAWAFAPGELLTVWTLILVASGIPSSGMMRTFLPNIAAPHYFSNDRNDWEARVWAGAPDWLKMHDAEAAKAFFTGYPRGQERIPWEAWAGPLFFWGVLAVLFLVASFCVANLLRRQWVENEKFAFPLVAVPLLLSEEPEGGRLLNRVLRSPLMWLAVLLTTALHTVNGLHLLYPSVPGIRTSVNLLEHLPAPPWSQLDWFPVSLHPLMVGLTYLLSLEVSFSFWFFFLFYKAQILLCAVYNWQMPGVLGAYGYKQFHALQSFGGAAGLLVWVLWTGKGHLRGVWDKAWGGPRAGAIDDEREMFSYRATLLGLLLSYGGIALWLVAAGVSAGLVLLSLLLMTLALVVISWMVCQAGMLFAQTAYGSIDIIAPTHGTAGLPVPSLYTQYRFEGSFFYNTREMVIPSVLNGAKAADSVGFPARRLFWGMVASIAITLVVSAAASLALPYLGGGANAIGNNWVYNAAPQKPLLLFGGMASVPYVGSWTNGLHILGGFGGVLGLLAYRAYLGLGLHPIGFLGASVHATHALWFSMFLGWLFKSLVLRYGGMKGYATMLPFFLGLIVGDVLNAVVWIALGYATGTGYRILP